MHQDWPWRREDECAADGIAALRQFKLVLGTCTSCTVISIGVVQYLAWGGSWS